MRPVLGLTTYLQQAQTGVWDVRASFLPAIYFEGVGLAGGIAVLLPPQPVDADIAATVLDGIDGLIITGGRDVVPTGYGQDPHPATDEPSEDNRMRDDFEFALVRGAIQRGMPVLGICRGAQVLNVALGGTLHQHLPDVLGHARHQQGNAMFSTSSVRTVPGTRLAELIGESSDAQCYHHQAIDTLGAGLIVSARDADGVIEAVEMPSRAWGHLPREAQGERVATAEGHGATGNKPDNFVLAVQWHPEERLDDLRLFAAAVEAAAAYANERVSA